MTPLTMVETLSAGSIASALRRITRDDAPEHRVEGRPVGGRDGGEAVADDRVPRHGAAAPAAVAGGRCLVVPRPR
jgi:hypothetical protein